MARYWRIRMVRHNRAADATWLGAAENADAAVNAARDYLSAWLGYTDAYDPAPRGWMPAEVLEITEAAPSAGRPEVVALLQDSVFGGSAGRDYRAFLLNRAVYSLRESLRATSGVKLAGQGEPTAIHWRDGWLDAVAALERLADAAGRGEVV